MPNAALAPNTPRTDAAAGGGTAASQSPQAQADRPVQGKVFPSPGGSGKPYRYLHKRHKRRRH
jgi:hypothetical protein